jgi:hypothetical protein
MHKNAMKCNETLRKWCKNKHGASKIMDTLETYQAAPFLLLFVGPWAITGDLNLIVETRDKSNDRINWRSMALFPVSLMSWI